MGAWIWEIVLIAAVWAARWGAQRLGEPLRKLRSQFVTLIAAAYAFLIH